MPSAKIEAIKKATQAIAEAKEGYYNLLKETVPEAIRDILRKHGCRSIRFEGSYEYDDQGGHYWSFPDGEWFNGEVDDEEVEAEGYWNPNGKDTRSETEKKLEDVALEVGALLSEIDSEDLAKVFEDPGNVYISIED